MRHLSEGGENSALLVVGVGGAAALPGIIIGPWGGVLGDRLNRRRLLIGLETFMALTALSFALLVKLDHVQVWHAYLYALIAGSCESVKMPLRQALVANSVPRHAISNAYATNVLTIPGTRMFGPFVGGVVVATFGFFWNFTIEAILYLGVVVSLLPMKTPYYLPVKREVRSYGLGGIFADLKDGFKYLWNKQRVLSQLIILSSVPNIICHPVLFLLPMFTVNILSKGVDYGGYMMAVNGAGGFITVLLLSAFGFPRLRGMTCIMTALGSGILTLLLSQSIWVPAAFLVLALFGATQTAYRTTIGVMTQTLVDDEYRVRVLSVYRIVMGMIVFFSILVGWFVDFTSLRWALASMGLLAVFISSGYFLFAIKVRRQE